MALPQTITGTQLNLATLSGPFMSSAGNTYIITGSPSGTGALRAYKAADPNTASFTNVGGVTLAGNYQSHDCTQVGDIIHCATIVPVSTNARVEYSTFNMATDTWAIETANTITSGATANGLAIAVCGNGDIYIIHPAATETVMSVARSRIHYSRKPSGGAWAAPAAFGPTGNAVSYGAPAAVVGASNRVHCVYAETSGNGLRHRSVSGTTLDTDTLITSVVVGSPGNIVYDGTLVHACYVNNSLGTGHIARATSQATPSWSLTAVADSATTFPSRAGQRLAMYGTQVQSLHQRSSDFDLLRDVYPSPTTDVLVSTDPPETMSLSANVITRGTSVILGFVYVSSGTGINYDEEVIDTIIVAAPIGEAVRTYPMAVQRAALR